MRRSGLHSSAPPPSGGDLESSPVEVLGHSARGTEALEALATAWHRDRQTWPLRLTIQGDLTIQGFTMDETAGTVNCLNGFDLANRCKRKVTFGAGCAGRTLRERRTIAARKLNLDLHPPNAVQPSHRARAAEAFNSELRDSAILPARQLGLRGSATRSRVR